MSFQDQTVSMPKDIGAGKSQSRNQKLEETSNVRRKDFYFASYNDIWLNELCQAKKRL